MQWTGQGVRYVQYPVQGSIPSIDEAWEAAFPGVVAEQISRPKSSLPMGTMAGTDGRFSLGASIQPGRIDLFVSWGENGDVPEPPEPLLDRAIIAGRRCVEAFSLTRNALVADVFQRARSYEDASNMMRTALPSAPFPPVGRDLKFGFNAPIATAEGHTIYRIAEWTTGRAQRLASTIANMGQAPTIVEEFHVFTLQADCSPPPSNQSMDNAVGLNMIDVLADEVRGILNAGLEHLTK